MQNLYVMLSRVTCWENLAILRPFDDSIFEMKPDENLLKFDEYLEDMDDNNVVECMSIEEIKRSIGIYCYCENEKMEAESNNVLN